MTNPGSQARHYHQATNHTLESVRSSQHRLVWNNQPRPFKLYVRAEPVSLGDLPPDSAFPALDAIASSELGDVDRQPLTTSTLKTLLHYSAGITRTISIGSGSMQFRAAACTGALYHIDVYLVAGPLDGLDPGVYQFGPQDGQLRRLRSGDFRSALADACGGEDRARRSEAMLVLTTTSWRNSWKYQARAYRHAFWDSGTMLANTLAVARAHAVPASVLVGFNDDAVNQLLALDTEREVAVAVVALGKSSSPAPPSPPVVPVDLETVPYSAYEVPEPLILETDRASSLQTNDEVADWRAKAAGLAKSQQLTEGRPVSLGEGPPVS
ncbi:MAG TPA: SagB/ThcOx family dehydrogenase, partial [Chloroflexota bacterium]|nr:SagB/ThcOx family dehydrogenase [Chloroflexota bacterium]